MIVKRVVLLSTLVMQIALAQGRGGGALDAIPNLTATQRATLARLTTDLSAQMGAVSAARNALAAAAFAEPGNPAAIPIMAGAVREAELSFAVARANALSTLQRRPTGSLPNNLPAWTAIAGTGPGGGGRGGVQYLTQRQTASIGQINTDTAAAVQIAIAARAALLAATPAEMPAKADALKAAEIALANARVGAFARLQSSPGQTGARCDSDVGGGRAARSAEGEAAAWRSPSPSR